jgi:hypothetical protein
VSDSSRRASARVRRARHWLDSAIVAHVLTLVTINVLVGSGYVQPAVTAAVVMVLATGPLLLLMRYERRHPSDDRPACWPARALATSLPQAVASGMVGAGLVGLTVLAPWEQGMLLACATVSVQVSPAVLASRTLRRRLTPELGETGVEILVKIRSNRGVARWLENDDVRLTDQEIITTVRPNFSWKGVICIALIDVVEVEARPGTSQDNPWFRLDEDFTCDVPPGDVVVIRHRRGTQVLPTYEAAALADLIRLRAAKLQSPPNARASQDTEQG